MLAAIALARPDAVVDTVRARKKIVVAAIKEVSSYLGNTPAVARASYIDPRVLDRYDEGGTIARSLVRLGKNPDFTDAMVYGVAEKAVARLLRT